MSYSIDTLRLQLRALTLRDAPFILELVNDPDCIRFIGDRNVHDIQDAQNYLLNGPLKMYEEHGIGLLMVIDSQDLHPIGMCGLLQRDYMSIPDIGYAFMPKYRGHGYAFEAANAVLRHAREQFKIEKVAAMVSPDNEISIALLEKLGLQYDSDLHREELEGPTKLYTS